MTVRPETVASHRGAVGRVITAIRANPSAPIGLDAMADIATMSRYHFLRVFQEITQVSPGRFLAALRMEQAKRLLLETSESITSVCYEVGYSSLGTFTRQFTEWVGTSPKSFRKRMARLRDCSTEELIASYKMPSLSGPTISGMVHAPADFEGYLFIGMFPLSIPQGLPASGAVMRYNGRYELPTGDRNHQFLLCAGFDCQTIATGSVAAPAYVGSTRVLKRSASSQWDVTLRPITSYDPPILVALPLLLHATGRPASASHSIPGTRYVSGL